MILQSKLGFQSLAAFFANEFWWTMRFQVTLVHCFNRELHVTLLTLEVHRLVNVTDMSLQFRKGREDLLAMLARDRFFGMQILLVMSKIRGIAKRRPTLIANV